MQYLFWFARPLGGIGRLSKADEPARMLTTQIGTESSNTEGPDPTAWKSMLIVHGRLYRCAS